MRKRLPARTWRRALAVALTAAIAHPAAGAPGDLTAIPAPIIGADPPRARDLDAGDASVATETGAFTYAYPIAVPPGRLGMQPSLSLAYSSQAPLYGGLAAGWTLALPEISRDTSRSMLAEDFLEGLDPNSWQRDSFVSTMAGGRPLVMVTEPTGLAGDALASYRAQNDVAFDRYERMENGAPYAWRVRSASGVTHYFGDQALAPATTAKWAPLTRSVDAFGNTVEYAWSGTDIQQIRYTSNPSAGLPGFATVDFVWQPSPGCAATARVNELDDRRLGIARGRQRLTMIRATAHDPGAPAAIRHTRELRLTYDAAAASCEAPHGPLNLLTTIQESAWGEAAPRVDLPPVQFHYNRLRRTFDQTATISAGQLGFGYESAAAGERENLGWGTRQNSSRWPTVNAMMLDFDGDGLADRLRITAHPTECTFVWQKNLGRAPGNGQVHFAADSDPIPMPRLPWASGAGPAGVESCSLSAQFTMYTTDLWPSDPESLCPQNTGTYLAYRWLDLNSDGLPDLVGAVHHDPRHFDPARLPSLPWAWPSCGGDTDGAGVAPDGGCMAGAVRTCDGDKGPYACGFDDDLLNACVLDATPATGNQLSRRSGSSFDLNCFEDCVKDCEGDFVTIGSAECNSACTASCTRQDRIGPPDPPPTLDCSEKKAHQSACGRYPWIVHWNQGGDLATQAEVIDQPLQLESEEGDSAFGGRGMSSAQLGIQDLDGDGYLDAIVPGRIDDADQPVPDIHVPWWNVFRGDGSGKFHLIEGAEMPYFWFTPPSTPIGLSCTGAPGSTCRSLRLGAPQTDDFDLRGLSMIADLTGDGAADLVWKHAAIQFGSTRRWEDVHDNDPLELFRGDGQGFQVGGTVPDLYGERLDLAHPDLDYLSRSHVDAEQWITNTTFATKAHRHARARLLDYDGDGRLDLLSAPYLGNLVWGTPQLFTNVGGAFRRAQPLGGIVAALGQETFASEAGFSAGDYHWESTRDLVDLDGDGLLESWSFAPNQATIVRDADRQPLRLMRKIDNGRGNTVEVSYAPTTDAETVTQNAELRKATPNPTWVVASVTHRDAWDATDTATTAYRYKHPVWNRDDEGRWGFRGFEEVTTTAPTGATTVATYGFHVDWSGRLGSTRTFSAETPTAPATIAETAWTKLTLFDGAIETFHPLVESSWTCRAGATEAACRSDEQGRVTTWTTWKNLVGQLWVAERTDTIDGPVFGAGGRRTSHTVALTSDAVTYRVRSTAEQTSLAIDTNPANDTLTGQQTFTYDSAGRYLLGESQFFAADLVERADTTFRYDPAGSGVRIAERRPRQQPGGPERTSVYDATRRFVVSTTDEMGLLRTAAYEPGTGAPLWSEGPNRVVCGPGCTNVEKEWTDVDGLGRPIATHVNRAVTGSAAWVKTQVTSTVYQDGIVNGAAPKVTNRTLLDYETPRWTQEITTVDGRGRPVRVAVSTGGASDAITTYDYDRAGNLVSVRVPDPSVEAGMVATVLYTYGYDSLGRPTSMRRPAITGEASGVDLSYDGVVTRSDEVAGGEGGPGASKILVNDGFGRLIEVRERTGDGPNGATWATTTYAYDARDAVAQLTSADGVVTALVHDFAGRRTKIERAGRTWTFGYDLHGNLVSESLPAPSPALAAEYTNTYAYDALDRVTSRAVAGRDLSPADRGTLAVGAITFAYDTCFNGMGRMCSATFPGGALTASYTYDAEGNASDEMRVFSFGGVAGTRATRTVYGPLGRVLEHAYADNANGTDARTRSRFTYDDRGLPSGLAWVTPRTSPAAEPPRPMATQVRNVAGQVLSRTAYLATTPGSWGWRDLRSTWSYDRLGRVASQHVADAAGGTPYAVQLLGYHGLDDPRTLRHLMGTVAYDFTYGHDARHQLTSVAENTGKYSATYGFTAGGKLAATRVTAPVLPGGAVVNRDITYAYGSGIDPDAPSGLVPVAGGANLRSYEYDTVGNLRARRIGDPTANPTDRLLYDGDDQLRRATKYIGTSVSGAEEYYYDHTGTRAAVVTRSGTGAVTKVRVFMGDTELELAPSGALLKAYAHLSLGAPVARVVSPAGGWTPSSTTTNADTVELMYQGLSSNTIATVNPAGILQAAFVYGPYGDVIQTSGNGTALASTRRRFNDEFRDDLTGLQYYGARYYDGLMLGWTQADPLYRIAPDAAWTDPRRANLYAFTLHNPLRYRDPDGRDAVQAPEKDRLPDFDPDRKRTWPTVFHAKKPGVLSKIKKVVKSGVRKGIKNQTSPWGLAKKAVKYGFKTGQWISDKLDAPSLGGYLGNKYKASKRQRQARRAERAAEVWPDVQGLVNDAARAQNETVVENFMFEPTTAATGAIWNAAASGGGESYATSCEPNPYLTSATGFAGRQQVLRSATKILADSTSWEPVQIASPMDTSPNASPLMELVYEAWVP